MPKVSERVKGERRYWLLKSEPDSFPFDKLWNSSSRTTHWDGIRNYQARNFMRDDMKKGDLAFFYHSGAEPGIVGIVEIVREGYPDHTAVDPKDPHYEPRTKGGDNPWSMVDVRAIERFSRPLPLSEMRTRPELQGMPLLKKGNRLSVQPVGAAEWNAVIAIAKQSSGD